jgi:hypothetical protein
VSGAMTVLGFAEFRGIYGVFSNKEKIMNSRHLWSGLNHMQLSRYAKKLVNIEFTLCGFSNVNNYFYIQVKSVRRRRNGFNYVFMKKAHFQLRPNLFVALVLFRDGASPSFYLIPSTVWENPDTMFVSKDYKNAKSEPEWGINLSDKHIERLKIFTFEL